MKLIDAGEFLEWAEVHGNLYGTSRQEIGAAAQQRGIIFDIDHQGARQIRSAEPNAVSIFILPPDMDILLKRLRGRASEDEETVQRRFAAARAEIAHYSMFDYVLVNGSVSRPFKWGDSSGRVFLEAFNLFDNDHREHPDGQEYGLILQAGISVNF